MAQILRVSVRGDMPNGEVWSVNPCWEINGSGGDPVSPGQAVTIAAALGSVTVPSDVLLTMRPTTRVLGYRVEARTLTGTLESQAEFLRPTPAAGTGLSTHPFQTSLCVSLRTLGVGASARGRMYWPATGQSLDGSTYRVSSTDATNLLAGFKSYLTSMETAIKATLPNANLTVWSRSTANFFNVASIQVGNVLDTQRRRRDALVEGYVTTSFP